MPRPASPRRPRRRAGGRGCYRAGVSAEPAEPAGTPAPTPAAAPAGPLAATPREIRVSAAVITDAAGRLLLVRKAGTSAFMQPGGKPEPGESPAATLARELAEEVGLIVPAADLEPLGEFRAAAANEPGFVVVADVFRADIGDQIPVPDAEIDELRWVAHAGASEIEVAPLAAAYFLPPEPFTLDGSRIDGIASFYDEVNRVLMTGEDWTLGPSLDALDDLLYGGIGSLRGVQRPTIVLSHHRTVRSALGAPATRAFYLGKLARPDVYDVDRFRADLAALDAGDGPTYFDLVLAVFADHPDITLVLD